MAGSNLHALCTNNETDSSARFFEKFGTANMCQITYSEHSQTVLQLIYVNCLLVNCIFFVQQAVIFYLSLTSQYIVVSICS